MLLKLYIFETKREYPFRYCLRQEDQILQRVIMRIPMTNGDWPTVITYYNNNMQTFLKPLLWALGTPKL